MLRWFNPAYISAGLVAVLVGYTSSAAIIFQALQTLDASRAITDSWFLVLGLGMGITCITLSLYYR
ncbi:MAG: benzoate/H(+) symporter BenE family transporter, partial [Gammaproteobacteria bacterium]|nr:benzoate/H(+) symporter BenE family transporter [Gammaproteobacteria bacterium]